MKNYSNCLIRLIVVSTFFILTFLLFTACQDTATTSNITTEPASSSVPTAFTPGTLNTPIAELTLPAVEPPTVSTPQYDLSAENGEAYLNLKNPTSGSSNGNATILSPYIMFDSVAEMREKLITGNLSENELAQLNRFSVDKETGKVSICNLNQLFELKLKNGVSQVIFYGETYLFEGVIDKTWACDFTLLSADEYTAEIENHNRSFVEQEDWKILVDKQIEDRNAREVHGQSSMGTAKYLAYTVETEHGTYVIYEQYTLEHQKNPSLVSDANPRFFWVYYNGNNGVYAEMFWGTTDPTAFSRPSIETLTSFWFEPLATNTSGNDHVTE